jgi:hypothetical protein
MQDWYRRIQGWFGADAEDDSMLLEAGESAADTGTGSDERPALDAKMLVTMVMSTDPDEIDCDEFFVQMDRFVELDLAGEDVAALMPLVQGHAERCRDCREEYEALRRALETVG